MEPYYIRIHITPTLTYLRTSLQTSLQIHLKQKANRKMTLLRSGVKLTLMKKLSLYLFLGLLWCNVSFADDVSEYQIEGIRIGDGLLDHLSKEEIKTEIEVNKIGYDYLTDEFGEVYLEGNFEIYDVLSFFVKPKKTIMVKIAIYI